MTKKCSRVSYPGWIDGFLEELFWKQLIFEYPHLIQLASFTLLSGGLMQNWQALLKGLPFHSHILSSCGAKQLILASPTGVPC